MAISYVSSASAAANTVAMPAHQAGDLILVFAFRDGSTTNPTVPTGYARPSLGNGTNTCSAAIGFKWAQSASETTGTFTNATGVVVQVYRGVTGLTTIVRGRGTGSTITHPAMTLTNTSGSTWVARFCGHRTATNLTTNTPAGFTARTGVATEARGMDTNGGVTSANSVNQSVNASSGWEAWSVELRGDSATSSIGTFADDFSGGSTTPDPSKWTVSTTGSGTAVVDTTNHQLVLTGAADSGTSGARVISGYFDLTGSEVAFQVVDGIGGNSFFTGEGVGIQQAAASGTYPMDLFWRLSDTGASMSASVRLNSNGTDTVLNSRTHTDGDWYRIRESSGTIYFDYSSNGSSWTNLASTSVSGPKTLMGVFVDCGHQLSGTAPFLTVDNINTPPSIPEATASGSYSWAGAATGKKPSKGTGSGSYTWAGSASGQSNRRATASGTYSWGSTAVGARTPKASASGAYQWDTGSVGEAHYEGQGAGNYAWAGTATGQTPVDVPTGSGAYGWAGSAVGYSRRVATVDANYGWAATVIGSRQPKASAGTSDYAFAGVASGKRVAKGVAAGSYAIDLDEAVGFRTGTAFAAGGYKWVALATGLFVPKPVAGVVGWYAE